MIDAYIDDENKYDELINMMNNNTSTESTERFASLEIMRNDLEVAENKIQKLETEIEELKKHLNSK